MIRWPTSTTLERGLATLRPFSQFRSQVNMGTTERHPFFYRPSSVVGFFLQNQTDLNYGLVRYTKLEKSFFVVGYGIIIVHHM